MNSPTPTVLKSGPRTDRRRAERSPALPGFGFVVADASLRPVSANHEAIAILTHAGMPGPPETLNVTFEEKIRRILLGAQSSPASLNKPPRVIQFKSGRRMYFCRAFPLECNKSLPNPWTVLIVMERGMTGSLALCQISQQFHLTHREGEVLALLLHGLSSKEIAARIGISMSTVKAFLRLVMIKMGVTSRSGISAKVLGIVLTASGTVLSLP